MLHRSGLVISNSPGQGKALRERGRKKKNKETMGKFANVFAIRYRGFDPERILNVILPFWGWMFTVPALIFFSLLLLSASLLLASQYETVYAKLPTFQQFFAADRWLILALTMAIVKVLHEFGHGLSCKKFGGECHEIGFMLLEFFLDKHRPPGNGAGRRFGRNHLSHGPVIRSVPGLMFLWMAFFAGTGGQEALGKHGNRSSSVGDDDFVRMVKREGDQEDDQ